MKTKLKGVIENSVSALTDKQFIVYTETIEVLDSSSSEDEIEAYVVSISVLGVSEEEVTALRDKIIDSVISTGDLQHHASEIHDFLVVYFKQA